MIKVDFLNELTDLLCKRQIMITYLYATPRNVGVNVQSYTKDNNDSATFWNLDETSCSMSASLKKKGAIFRTWMPYDDALKFIKKKLCDDYR